jgi:hypothetical protein
MECFEAPIKSSALKHSLAPFALFLVWMSLPLGVSSIGYSICGREWNGKKMEMNGMGMEMECNYRN